MAADLCETARADGTTADGEFWYATAAKLLAPLLFAAARGPAAPWPTSCAGSTPRRWPRWRTSSSAPAPAEALHAAQATWCRDERTRSSVSTTAETVLAPFAQRLRSPVAAPFEPADLLGGRHTLYLCAPAHDQRRLRGLLHAR